VSETYTRQSVLFPDLFRKPLIATFDQQHASSDGGAIMLKAADRRLGLIDGLTACLEDRREPGKVVHSLRELLAQRVFAIACGYPDANDSARLAHDPIHKLLLDRDPIHGNPLASQPTLSRFENSVRRGTLYRMGEAHFERVIERHGRRLRRVRHINRRSRPNRRPHARRAAAELLQRTLRPLVLPAGGGVPHVQREPDQYLAAAVLRPGNAPAQFGALPLLKRILRRLQERFPAACLLVRLDGGFAGPEVFEFLDEVNVRLRVAMFVFYFFFFVFWFFLFFFFCFYFCWSSFFFFYVFFFFIFFRFQFCFFLRSGFFFFPF